MDILNRYDTVNEYGLPVQWPIENKDGTWVYAKEATAAIKQARIDALEEAAMVADLYEYGWVAANEIRKLKEVTNNE